MTQEQNQKQQTPWGKMPQRLPHMAPSAAGDARGFMGAVASAGVNVRVEFLRRTYAHLFGAILAFAGLTYLFLGPLYQQVAVPVLQFAMSTSWLLFMGLFMVASWVADKWARSPGSRGKQYLGLGLYVLAESVFFIPLLVMAQAVGVEKGSPDIIQSAAIATLLCFAGLTATVFVTRKDFSFLRGVVSVGMMAAFGLIVASVLFGFSLGIVFTVAMIALAAMYILYTTSQVMAHYHPQQHVAASVALFAGVALLFWYVLQLFMSRD